MKVLTNIEVKAAGNGALNAIPKVMAFTAEYQCL